MPEISRFFGIVIAMFYRDHDPPHFRARYNQHRANIAIHTLEVLDGSLPPRVLGLVVEWAAMHQRELLENWERARRHEELLKIAPLE
ncbi:MAG: DUF4160 domain-containing protein [Firmicutes bacterium]|nr:DUF4160 domain-containing protein [Alicyclobacillaceae bacterium]MCL6498379.1 DUF4160 domain-containing protein [Bacillota bacterium]